VTRRRAVVVFLLAVAACITLAGRVRAMPATLSVRPVHAGAPLELRPSGSSFRGEIELENRGDKPVEVTARLREGSAEDPRLPPGMNVSFGRSTARGALRAGEKRSVTVEWAPRRDVRVHEVWGQVLFEAAGDPVPAVVAFHAGLGATGITAHPLSLLLALPLLGALVLIALGRRRLKSESVVLTVAIAELALLAWLVARFDVGFTRFVGSDGLQLVERVVLARAAGIQWFLALDGIALALAFVVPVLTLCAAALDPGRDHGPRFWALLLACNAGLFGVIFAFDLALALAFWLLALASAVGMTRLVAGSKAAYGLFAWLGVASVLIGFAFYQLSGGVASPYLPDGTRVARLFDLTEISHGGWSPPAATILGVHSVKIVYGALFLGCATLMAAAPFHAWLAASCRRAASPLAMLVAGGLSLVGGYWLLRVGYAALPDGTAWAAPALGVIGVLSALYAAFASLAAEDLSSFLGYSVSMQSGLVLLSLSADTAIGVQGAVALLASRALFVALGFGLCAAVTARHGTTELARLGGIMRERPALGLLGAIALLAAAGGPGTLSFVGAFAGVFGTFPTHGLTCAAGLVTVVVISAAHLFVYLRAFGREHSGAGAGSWTMLEERQATTMVALAVLLCGLGFWPRPLLWLASSSSFDQAEYVNPPGPLEVSERPTRLREYAALRDRAPR
jgi:NADH:ubiquinone oxidoreductase subunit 4 (subunit M)